MREDQWMRGGMTMVGDMFDNALKARIDALCGESAQLLTTTTVFPAATPGSRSGGFTSANWWPTPPLPHPRRRYPTLHQAPPILSDEEFATKKAELLGKVAVVAVVGNEDGAHHIVAEAFQALNDVGYTIPAQGCTYWNGPAMGKTDYNDLDEVPKSTASVTAAAACNAAHLAGALKASRYPPYPS
jgi:hypothetical protein